MPQRLAIGDYVELTENADFLPHAILYKGARGRVARITGDEVDIRMDRKYPGLARFDNCIWITPLVPGAVQFKHVQRDVKLSYAIAAAIALFIMGAAAMETVEAQAQRPGAAIEYLWADLGLSQANHHVLNE